MSIFIAILLGIVQGLCEFLPISSSGHLVLFQQIFGLTNNNILFDVVLHLGTVIAVIFVFKDAILNLIKNPFSKKANMLYVATAITLILAFFFQDFFETMFLGEFLFLGFLITALFLLFAQYAAQKTKNQQALNYKNTAVMGLFQAVAIMPGISRSGSTITSAIVQGVNKEDAAEFSFLMSLPIIIASLVFELVKWSPETTSLELLPMLAGFITAILFGVISIKIMLNIIKKTKYVYFTIYLVLLSAFLILNKFVLFWF